MFQPKYNHIKCVKFYVNNVKHRHTRFQCIWLVYHLDALAVKSQKNLQIPLNLFHLSRGACDRNPPNENAMPIVWLNNYHYLYKTNTLLNSSYVTRYPRIKVVSSKTMFRFGRLTALSSHGTNDVDTGLSFILYSLNDVGVVKSALSFCEERETCNSMEIRYRSTQK